MRFRFDHHIHGSFPGKNRKMQPTVQVQKDAQAVSACRSTSGVFLHLTSRYWINIEGSRSPLTIERPVTPEISDTA